MTMSPTVGHTGLDEEWETGGLGESESHVRKSSKERTESVDDALQLQMISIRLHKDLLDQLKLIAKCHRVGYQPMIRDVLGRWARSEINAILDQYQREVAARSQLEAIAADRSSKETPIPTPTKQKKRA